MFKFRQFKCGKKNVAFRRRFYYSKFFFSINEAVSFWCNGDSCFHGSVQFVRQTTTTNSLNCFDLSVFTLKPIDRLNNSSDFRPNNTGKKKKPHS